MAHYDLANIRRQCKLSQQALADRLGHSLNKIQYSERGKGSMSYSSLIRIGLGAEMTDFDEIPEIAWNGEALYHARKDMKLSQKKFAALVGANFRDISRWEMGYNEPRAKMVERISKTCGKKISNFYISSVAPEKISSILTKMTTVTESFSLLIETGKGLDFDFTIRQAKQTTYAA